MVRVLKPGSRFAICNGGGGSDRWPLKDPFKPADIPKDATVDGLFQKTLDVFAPGFFNRPSGSAPQQTETEGRSPVEILTEELESAGLENVSIWSYGHTSPFESAEEIFEWESIRWTVFRMNKDELDDEVFDSFKTNYLELLSAKLAEHGVLGLSTGALFGTGLKSA